MKTQIWETSACQLPQQVGQRYRKSLSRPHQKYPWRYVSSTPSYELTNIQDPMQLKQMLVKPSDRQLAYNISYSDMSRPLAGPVNPFKPDTQMNQKKNVLTGYAEQQDFSEAAFRTQNRTFQALGYARNPSLHTNGG